VPKYPHIELLGQNGPLSKKRRSSVPKKFMTTPIHVSYSNFREMNHRLMAETMRCIGDKSSQNAVLFAPILHPFGVGHQQFAGKGAT